MRRHGLVDTAAERREVERLFALLRVDIRPMPELVNSVSPTSKWSRSPGAAARDSVMISDEPTAALTEKEVTRFFAVVQQIAATGVGIVYVSHRLGEIFELCDDVTIVRDGRAILSTRVADTSMKQVVEAIAGGVVEEGRLASSANGSDEAAPPVLAASGPAVGSKLRVVAFTLRPGEVVGIAGLAGSGRSTLLKALFGLIRRNAGDVHVAGRLVRPTSPAQAISAGLYLIPENRKTQGLVLSHSVADNLVLSILDRLCVGPLLGRRKIAAAAAESVRTFRIHPPDPSKIVERLSGGNQQKVVLGKAFNARGRVLLLDEPTFGVDIHSRAEIGARVREFVDAGNAALWVTSDLRELADVADKIPFYRMARAGI